MGELAAAKAPVRVHPMLQAIEPIGNALDRPECVLCTASGAMITSHRHGVVVIDGGQQRHYRWPTTEGFLTNGVALLPDGRLLLANLGPVGGVWQMDAAGHFSPFLLEVDGVQLPPINYVGYDSQGRVWITASTRLFPRDLAFRTDIADGFVVQTDTAAANARIVLDGLAYTNEVHVHPNGQSLYVVETMGRRITSFALLADGSLGRVGTTVAQFGPGTFPDGFEFDADGGIWVANIVGNRLVYVAPDGAQTMALDDSDAAEVAASEAAFHAGHFVREHLEMGSRRTLGSITSVAFGGDDLRTLHLGSLAGQQVLRFRVQTAGAAPAHWNCRPGATGLR